VSESEVTMGAGQGALMEESPYGIQSKKLAMWLFIISDTATFGAMLVAYGYTRVGSHNWSTPFEFSPTIINAMVMTLVLLTSSLTMLAAVRVARAGLKSAANKYLAFTMILGAIFAILHIREWAKMFAEGWGLFTNPTGGAVQFGAAFFSITGLHLLHVISGVVALLVITLGYNRGRFDAYHVETTGLYWHFVDVVWMFVFPLMYLLNAKVG
jgi:cytochrome c oxidase subunit III